MRAVLDRAEDSPEAIKACLNCTRPPNACNACGGPLKSKNPHHGGRRGAPPEVIEQALAMAEAGVTHKEIAAQLGIAKATVSFWKWKFGGEKQ